MRSSGDKELPAASKTDSITTLGSNIGQLIVLVTLLSTPSPQVSETGGIQSTLVVPVALLSMPLSQVSETGTVIGVQPSLLVEAIVPTVLLSAAMSHVSDAGGVVVVFVLASVVLAILFVLASVVLAILFVLASVVLVLVSLFVLASEISRFATCCSLRTVRVETIPASVVSSLIIFSKID